MKTDVETQLRSYWDTVYDAYPGLDAEVIRRRPAPLVRRERRMVGRPVFVAGLAALLVVVLIGGAALLFGSPSTAPADEAEPESDLLLDYPASETPPFRGTLRIKVDPRAVAVAPSAPADAADVLVIVSYGGHGRLRIDVDRDIAHFEYPADPGTPSDPPPDDPAATAGSYIVMSDEQIGRYVAGGRTFVLGDAPAPRGGLEPLAWEGWDALCAFGEHEFLDPTRLAGRDALRLRCTDDDTYELWVDTETGLVLRAIGGEVQTPSLPAWVPAVGYEFTSIEYEPTFEQGLFDLEAPPGAEFIDARGELPPAVEIGRAAPGLVGTTLDGAAFDLTDLRGLRTAILFWSSWCEPCLEALADVADTARSRADVTFVTVLIDERHEDAHSVLLDRELDLTDVDQIDLSGSEFAQTWAPGVPALVLVDRDGTVASVLLGYGPLDTVEGLIRDSGW